MEAFTAIQELITELQKQQDELRQQNIELRQRLENLETRFSDVVSKKNEHYYQKFLEKKLSGMHCKTRYGITDITTHTEHIEIKHWDNYKSAMGQLLSYNHDNQKQMCVYFFGHVSPTKKETIIDLYRKNNISIKELIDTPDGISICDILDTNTDIEKIKSKNFQNWLDENIGYKEGGFLKLSDTLELYLGKKISPRLLGKYRKEIEVYIKEKIKNANYEYKQFWIGEQKYKGWMHVQLKQ